MKQIMLTADENYSELDRYFIENQIKKIFLVCDNSFDFLSIKHYFDSLNDHLNINIVRFDDFKPNPEYESVVRGVESYNKNNCDCIMAVGGGSAIDVAKCVKLYSNMNSDENYLSQVIVPNDIRFLAIPTTAGTGSEATRYAVIYYNGEKQSVTDESCIPTAVMLDPSLLKTLPEYQRKSTMLDAFCHAVESFWSVNSTEESKAYSAEAINLILKNMDLYLGNKDDGNAGMLLAANIAGKAINITQTTAGHAMCYKLTSIYGIAHGHAAALCVSKLWLYIIQHTDMCVDSRGKAYLEKTLNELASAMGCVSTGEAAKLFNNIFDRLELETPVPESENDLEILASSVNTVRLKNNPVQLDNAALNKLYHQVLGESV